VTREDADELKLGAEEAEKAAAADNKKGVELAISAMEHQLEKILENIEDLIKEKEEEMGSKWEGKQTGLEAGKVLSLFPCVGTKFDCGPRTFLGIGTDRGLREGILGKRTDKGPSSTI
jgi:hypothetical protein